MATNPLITFGEHAAEGIPASRNAYDQKIQAERQYQIAPYALNVKDLQQKLQTVQPNSPEHQQIVDQMQQNIHSMREILHPDWKPGPTEWLKTHLTDRLHITNANKRAQEHNAQAAQNRNWEQAMTQADVGAAPQNPIAMKLAEARVAGASPAEISELQRELVNPLAAKETAKYEPYRLANGQIEYLDVKHPERIPQGSKPVITGAAAQGPSLINLGGVPYAVKDPAMGKTYSESDIKSGKVPPDVLSVWNAGHQAYKTSQKQKQEQFEREQRAILERQKTSNQNMLDRMAVQFRNMLSAGSFRSATATVEKLQQSYSNSLVLENRMKQLEPKALKGDQQAMLAILANHIAMTTHQPGASMRPTKALFDEAAAAQPWLQKVEKRVGLDGVISGVVLSPQQIKQMVNLAPIMVEADKDALTQTKSMLSDELNPSFNGSSPPPEGRGASLPEAARKQLKEGQVTTFGNGQEWTLENGQPRQVK